MKTPETSRLFTRWKNPTNGIESLILTERPAPVQQTFYYTSPSFTEDGRFLWLGFGFPPPGGMYNQQVLGVVDFEADQVRVYPETQLSTSRPMADLTNGEIYWFNRYDLWKRGPLQGDKAVLVNSFPAELGVGRLDALATHPTFSPDRRSINVDARFGRKDGKTVSILGSMPLDGSPFQLWAKVEGRLFNHALFSPIDGNLQMCAHEYWQDHAADPFDHDLRYHRMWLVRPGQSPEPILREPVSHSGHEWWDASGKSVWYLHYGGGVKKVDLETREETMAWPGALSHAHSDRSGRYLVADRMDSPTDPDCNVLFRDLKTGKTVELVNRPPLAPGLTRCVHLHPHPQFCRGDKYICYTTLVHDRVDLALTSVDLLRSATA